MLNGRFPIHMDRKQIKTVRTHTECIIHKTYTLFKKGRILFAKKEDDS